MSAPRRSEPKPTSRLEQRARRAGFQRVAGVDEAGRGCLFGPVVAAAVILDPARPIRGLADSKLLDARTREALAAEIRERAAAWAAAEVSAAEIDRVNILQASRIAMETALARLAVAPDFILTDAMKLTTSVPHRAVVHGDRRCRSIAAASIIAKTERDALMTKWAAVHPEYDFASNKGYGTARHLAALRRHGPAAGHRRTFAPVAAVCFAASSQRDLFAEVAE